MGDLTIRDLDDDLVRRLETRAAANGRSLDEEIRLGLERVARGEARPAITGDEDGDRSQEQPRELRPAEATDVDEEYRAHLRRMAELGTGRPTTKPTQAEIERRMKRLNSIAKKPDEPFDLKAFSDELYDYLD